ncbi:3-ketoacyl-CoA synthase 5 [Sorghum bicolor]|uniref:3-ketoacyl-CoA synthase n=1 Tax=Sorghum bicolor TaxID=4558 RepID=C5Z837_SORBI|nr:3-ketoacyl-CoA synthase 5 [Sorghum bicolor]EER89567.1 hypothetical protein SORBI_3010G108600 [Sorghum bicolor]|eukprot:XP_002438200.1 3-ketoacyl-CoA synthase 5 [Sorghum bicolor]
MIAMILEVTQQLCQDRLLTLSTNNLPPIHHLLVFLLITVVTVKYLIRHPRRVYLVEYTCFGPDSKYRVAPASMIEYFHLANLLDDDNISFLSNIYRRSGLGDETCLPSSYHYIPFIPSLSMARMEAELVIFTVIDDLFAKASIEPSKIDILIVNCSAMTMVPSMTDMIINRYKLRRDIQNMQLSGMGCSAGLIAVGLASNLLQIMPYGANALVVSTENVTCNYYVGKKRSMQLTNILFRMGGAAVLLSNSSANARFQLLHTVRKSTAAQDNAYHCVFHEEDDEGNLGLNLSKNLVAVAGEALKANISTSARLLLPVSEQLSFLLSSIAQKVFLKKSSWQYVPKFGLAVEHFCIHAGGRAVIDAVQRSLDLSDEQVEPSRMTLHRFGNTSSSSVWYEMAYCEAKQLMRKGDRVWMIGFGSGYKCNSAVWKCILPARSADSAWANCIHRYPMEVPKQV